MPINSKKVLVVGGAGFIGSHMVLQLQRTGYEPIVLDNLSKGHRDAVLNAEFIQGDINDSVLLDQVFATHNFIAVMHFAAFIEVGESVMKPALYYQNNVAGSVNLLAAMSKAGVKHLIFSSTAAVYGEPQYQRITEAHPIAPVNPYARSKWMVEEIIKDFAKSDGLNYVNLRYFNAAGADPDGRLRERHEPESHLIPIVLQAAKGLRPNVTIHGDKYPTADGTCIRDYVHVSDLCQAHLLALTSLLKNQKSMTLNLGTGKGYSVLQVINAAKRVTGQNIQVAVGPPRAGDVAVLVADAALAQETLRWSPRFAELDTIIEHAWKVM